MKATCLHHESRSGNEGYGLVKARERSGSEWGRWQQKDGPEKRGRGQGFCNDYGWTWLLE